MGVNTQSAPTCAELETFLAGQAVRAYDYLGAHPENRDGTEGYVFRVWAPHAAAVGVMGDFNAWNEQANPLTRLEGGVWEGFIPGLQRYDTYKYAVQTKDGRSLAKADPYAFHAETRPGNASKLYDLAGYGWGDESWLKWRKDNPIYEKPLNIYEVHLGSWRRTGEDEFLSYRAIAEYLVPYVKEMGFTHVELMPVTEHPLDASWGYQCTGYFAATSRYGTPHDFMYLVDQLHQAGIGVLLDWVPAHFPKDAFGLYEFDGEACYEYADPRKGEHADWGTRVFDYGRNEVRSFLFSSAMFWLEQFHIDGLRVDAVASMLYLDYSREEGQWIPNQYGGKENLEAVDFLRTLNTKIFLDHPDVLMVAEESTSWPLVSHPVHEGGLGFNLKWNMGWMNDITHYMKLDPYFRQFNHRDITFSLMYAFSENFVLPLSHDEVVHMKGSFLNKMPGTDEEQRAGVRAFYTYMLTHPGKKLLMMGSEFGQWNEWHYEHSLDWHLLDPEQDYAKPHIQLQQFFKEANALYLAHSELWEQDFSWQGFQWLCADDHNANCAGFLRWSREGRFLAVLCNFSPVHRDGYRIGVPVHGRYEVIFNSDAAAYGGTDLGDQEPLKSEAIPCHGQDYSVTVDLPPMSAVILSCTRKFPVRRKKAETPAPAGKKRAAKAAAEPAAPHAEETPAPKKKGPAKKSAGKKAASQAEPAAKPKRGRPKKSG